MGKQLTLNLGRRFTLTREDYYVSKSNSMAIRALDDWTLCLQPGLIIVGPKSSGKTHLASVWMNETGADSFQVSELASLDVQFISKEKFIVIENLDSISELSIKERNIAEEKILHMYNFLAASGGKLLMTAVTFPIMWNLGLKDLLSRLMSLQIAELSLPDDKLLAAIMAKQFVDRQIVVPSKVIEYAMARMERSFSFAKKLVDELDIEALSLKKPINKKLVNDVISRLGSRSGN